MTIKNISGSSYYTVDDIIYDDLRNYLKDTDCSVGNLGYAGYELAKYIQTNNVNDDLDIPIQDLIVVLSLIQSKALEIKVLTNKLRQALKLEIGEL